MLLSGFTASCGLVPGSSQNSQNQKPSQNSTQTDAQPNAQTSASGNAVSIPPPVALPPSYGDRPDGTPNQSGQQPTLPNGLPALQAKGVNVDELFAQDVTNTDQRFDRLENAVLDLRREFESFKPAIVRLVAVEADIQDLIEQLDVLLRTEPAPVVQAPTPLSPAPRIEVEDTPQIETKPKVAPPPEPAPQPAPQPSVDTSGPTRVSALRVGRHSNKLRLVMDVTRKTDFTIDLDNQEHILIIEMPSAQWATSEQKNFGSSPLLSSYTTESINDGQGTRVVITLKKSTSLIKSQGLPPGPTPYYRIYADLQL